MKYLLMFFVLVLLIVSGCTGGGDVTPVENGEEVVAPEENGEDTLPPARETDREIPSTAIQFDAVLTEERAAAIQDYLEPFQGMFTIFTMLENDNALEIWLDVGPEPITDDAVRGLTDGVILDLIQLLDQEVAIRLTALQEDGSGGYHQFGTSVYSPETGEITYESL